MSIFQEPIFQWLSQYAYQPELVYAALVGMMFMSAIGLPLPEEVTLVSIGVLAFMGANPHHFPPPFEGAPVVNMHTAAIIASVAVFGADFLIYAIGRIWGRRMLQTPFMKKIISPEMMEKVENWTKKYGAYACGIFRFTPGIRFPGHLACGMMHFPIWKFALIDGIAVMISVPTQIYLLAIYGEPIIKRLHQFKMVLFGIIGIILIAFIAKKIKNYFMKEEQQSSQ
ncbi:DedA family protein [Bdellovibrio sp. HCB337]|uniref:DedA family protein n=1 Tax=Bdellovibrio sp. HCB337 TaxID=3394358 RepID=UPI0039A4B7AE